MPGFYSEDQRRLQDLHDTRRLADAVERNILRRALTETDRDFISSRDFFFLSTVDADGFPTVSYKGGGEGFVRVEDDTHLLFPIYDGNGMFLSAGNIAAAQKVGLLFIDFEHPKRLRVHGRATLVPEGPERESYPEALMAVRVEIGSIFTNCPRYIHRHARVAQSEFVPVAGRKTPVPEWKRVDYLQDALPARDKARAEASGPRITEAEYRAKFWARKTTD